MLRILGTIFAGLFGLAFGSFLNVCLSRWPTEESIVTPGSHCRNCGHMLTWLENIPLFSWIVLRGRCSICYGKIGWRYPLVESAVAVLWALQAWHSLGITILPDASNLEVALTDLIAKMIFAWLLVALAMLDAESFWLPDKLTISGIGLGIVLTTVLAPIDDSWWTHTKTAVMGTENASLAILICAGLILLIRWLYKLIRRREGLGLGDAKLMAMLAAWLGLPGALLALAIGVVIGTIAALIILVIPSLRRDRSTHRDSTHWSASKLPLGTFLCIGGVISSLWGQPIINAYLRWSGL
ncbi:MAG: prepilin peptidase [Terracidiphilus sp.]|jgi:leader peptidase (prepilin peptidase)/N-methyltransferase